MHGGVLVLQTLGLVAEGSRNEALEQRMGMIRAALEFGMELDADVEFTVGQLHGLDQTAVGAGAG